MLGQRRRRWTNVKPTLFQCLVFAGMLVFSRAFHFRAYKRDERCPHAKLDVAIINRQLQTREIRTPESLEHSAGSRHPRRAAPRDREQG